MNHPNQNPVPDKIDELAKPVQPAPGDEPTLLSETRLASLPEIFEDEGRRLKEGEKIGRYVVLKELGAGGMGVVYAAYDPELDRKIALKLLHPGRDGSKKETAKLRLLREAQAMARLDHPNVIPVHDVGTHADSVFLAMEFVEGETMGQWMKENGRSWKEILDVFEMAGRGLSAAHDKGLVHRDFKPDNVMVGHDGRVRVMDFGLARPSQDEFDTPTNGFDAQATAVRNSSSSMFSQNITRAGAIMGTPAYMSPEQMNAEETDAATDQFSFCVALWEALYKERPFKGDTLGAMMFNVTQGHLSVPKNTSEVPKWLRKVLQKGLQKDSSKRFESMPTLLDAFSRGQSRAKMRKVLLGIAGTAALTGVGLGAYRMNERQKERACEQLGDSLSESWNENTRRILRKGFIDTGESYAKETADKTIPWLDKWADSWSETRTETCLASDVLGTWTPELRAMADECLDERRMRFDSLVEEMTHADANLTRQAVTAAAGLPDAKLCNEEHYLKIRPPLPEGGAEQARDVQRLLSRASSLIDAGKYEEGETTARDALNASQLLGHKPLIAESKATLGVLLRLEGDYDAAEKELSEAYLEAGTSGAPEVAFRAATKLVYIAGYRKSNFEEGMIWGKAAEVTLRSTDLDEGLQYASLLSNLGIVNQTGGNFEEARTMQEKALAIREAELTPNDPVIAVSLNNLAVLEQLMGHEEAALPLHEKALAIRENALGKEHPDVGYSLSNMAAIYQSMGKLEEAKSMYERVTEIWGKTLDPNHPNIGATYANLAEVLESMGDLKEARRLHLKAKENFEVSLGPDHPQNAVCLQGLASIDLKEGSAAEAIPLMERVMELRDKDRSNLAQYAEGAFLLAKALWDAPEDQGRDRKRALESARQAKEFYLKSGNRQDKIEQIDAWLSER